MKNVKKLLALGLASAMTLSLASCCNENNNPATGNEGSNASNVTENSSGAGSTENNTPSGTSADGKRIINIGTWWAQHYDSGDTALEDSEDYANSIDKEGDDEAKLEENALNRQIFEWKFANVDTLEQKYNIEFYWKNLTFTGVQESINTSILAGTPDCDIYLVDLGMALPAQMNGLALDLKTVLPADADVFTDQKIISYMDLGDGKVSILKRVEAQSAVEATYPLAFNMQILEDYNLEDPRDLYARGEWTWDIFNQYCQTLTDDTDGDGQIDQYGYCGYEFETFENLMMSNGASIATGKTQTLDSAGVGEALQQMYDMYNVYNVCYPYDFEGNASDSMRNQYTQGNIGFFPMAAWISAGNGDYDWDGSIGYTLPFDIAYVQWPVGPSGSQETNAGKNQTSGEFYIIPAGVKDPETVYDFLYDYWNWGPDEETTAEYRDNRAALNWWYSVTAKNADLQEQNFAVMNDIGSRTIFDLWNSMGISYDFISLIRGEVTPAQFQETYKQQIQDGLDAYFK